MRTRLILGWLLLAIALVVGGRNSRILAQLNNQQIITSDQLPQLQGWTWAADVVSNGGEHLVVMLNYQFSLPGEGLLTEYYYSPSTRQLRETWQVLAKYTSNGLSVFDQNSNHLVTLQTHRPHLIAGGHESRLLRMPSRGQPRINLPIIPLAREYPLECCSDCWSVHCVADIEELNCICCFWRGGCGFSCGVDVCP